jgi:sulfofructose kinase
MSFQRVVGLGLCVVDRLLVVDDLDLRAARTRCREQTTSPGGMVSTALAQAALLGCRAQLISMVGDDPEGRWLARELRRRGVGTRFLVRNRRFPTSQCVVLVDARGGERRFMVVDRRRLEQGAPRFDLSPIGPRSLLLVDGHFPEQALRAVKRAHRSGATVIGDFSAASPSVRRLLPFVDYPIVPLEFVEDWGVGDSRETLRALHRRYGSTPVVTQGRSGALVLHRGRVRRIPAHRVRVRDTTGAGDVFHGAFAAALVHGRDPLEALQLASRAAAFSCTALGGMGRLMKRSEI